MVSFLPEDPVVTSVCFSLNIKVRPTEKSTNVKKQRLVWEYEQRSLEINTEVQARKYRDKEKQRYQSRDSRLESSREVGREEEAGGWDTNSKTISGKGKFSLQVLEKRGWDRVGEATLGTGCSTSPWSEDLCPAHW